MKTYVITRNEIEGIHCWHDAPALVKYLQNPHRHTFNIRCEFEVKDDDREIEIIIQENRIRNYVKDNYGEPALFGGKSCEMIAKEIVRHFENCVSCQVLEDGYGGARVEKEETR